MRSSVRIELPFHDLNGGTGLGLEASEDVATRIDIDDVDDYHGWTSSPPYVNPDELDRVVAGNLGVKRVTVRVARAQTELAARMTIVTEPPA